MEFLSSSDRKPPMKGIINKDYITCYIFSDVFYFQAQLRKNVIFSKKAAMADRQKGILSIFPRFFPYPGI
jgi:hypothetical protein